MIRDYSIKDLRRYAKLKSQMGEFCRAERRRVPLPPAPKFIKIEFPGRGRRASRPESPVSVRVSPNSGIEVKRAGLRVLQPELALVHLCLHAFDDRYVYHWKDYDARQLLDIGLMVWRLSMDWAKAYREATRAAYLVPLALVLKKVNHCSPGCIPARALEQFANARPTTLERIILTKRGVFHQLPSHLPQSFPPGIAFLFLRQIVARPGIHLRGSPRSLPVCLFSPIFQEIITRRQTD